jgi:hypothetical protein
MCKHGLWLIPEWNYHHWSINRDSKTCALSKDQAPLKLTIRQNQRSDLTSFDTHPPFDQSRKLKKVCQSWVMSCQREWHYRLAKWWFLHRCKSTWICLGQPCFSSLMVRFTCIWYLFSCKSTKNLLLSWEFLCKILQPYQKVTLEFILWLLVILLCLFYSRCPPTFFVFS